MEHDATARAVSAVLARATHDADFSARFAADPRTVLAEAGLELPAGVEMTVLTSTPSKAYLVIPDAELMADELLASSSGGSTLGTAGTVGTIGSTLACAGTAGSARP